MAGIPDITVEQTGTQREGKQGTAHTLPAALRGRPTLGLVAKSVWC